MRRASLSHLDFEMMLAESVAVTRPHTAMVMMSSMTCLNFWEMARRQWTGCGLSERASM